MLDVKRNLTTIMDFYELTMAAGYLEEGYEDLSLIHISEPTRR